MKPILLHAVCISIISFASTIQAELNIASSYDVEVLGYTDTEHTRYDGNGESMPLDINNAGQVMGNAIRYNGGYNYFGQSTWLYDRSGMHNIGLLDAEHTRDDGYRYSEGGYLSEAGQVSGIADRFNSTGESMGRTAWLYNGTSTIKVGLVDAEHTRDDGFRNNDGGTFSDNYQVLGNESGHVAGVASRYNGNTYMGDSAWIYNGISTNQIGLIDADHTSVDGLRHNNVLHLNDAGIVIGVADRHIGTNTFLGKDVWLYNGTNTITIGLVDAEHTRNDGSRFPETYSTSLNEAGQVIGASWRFNGNIQMGWSAWFYNGTNTSNIGLVDTDHTRDDGYRRSVPVALNDSGQVAGFSNRFNGTDTRMGGTAWLYDGTSHTYIGLQDAEHTSIDGFQFNSAKDINEAGQVTGHAGLFNEAGDPMGSTAWLYDGTDTIGIGLKDARHTRDDGWSRNSANLLNELGQVAGHAHRYNDYGDYAGITSWVYDLTIDETFAFELSVSSSGGAYSSIRYLGDDGLVLGWYRLYGAEEPWLSERAFAFTVEEGLYDLGTLVDGGLDDAGWDSLATAYKANNLGQIIGLGYLTDMPLSDSYEWYPNMGYLLTPKPVPIPATVWLFGSGLLGLVGIARRRSNTLLPIKRQQHLRRSHSPLRDLFHRNCDMH